MSDFDSNDVGRVFPGRCRGLVNTHIGQVLLLWFTDHSGAGNVEEGKYARLGLIDHLALEKREVTPARGAGIYNGGDPRFERKVIGREAEHAIGKLIGVCSDEYMGMDVDESGTDVQTGSINDSLCICDGYVLTYFSDVTLSYGNVALCGRTRCGVDYVSILYKQIISLRLYGCAGEQAPYACHQYHIGLHATSL